MRSIETLRSVGSFKPDSIPKETLDRILRAASMAASGSNTQPWEFVVVQDRDVKARLKEPMLKKWLERIGGGTGMSQRMKETYDEATEMLRNSEKVPALVYCCLDLNRIGRGEEVRYASIYPAVQNLMLAAHAFGLGTCLTIHGSKPTRGEPESRRFSESQKTSRSLASCTWAIHRTGMVVREGDRLRTMFAMRNGIWLPDYT